MTATDFRAWLERRGWDAPAAAPHFNVHRTSVWRWMNTPGEIPGTVARIVELMDEQEQKR